MLSFLLDEHVSPDVAVGLRRIAKDIVVYSLTEWQGGRFIGALDQLLLLEAAPQKLTLVTYDLRTIPNSLRYWAELEREHSGVIFVDVRTIPASEVGALIKALKKLHLDSGEWNWTNRTLFLRR